MKAATKPADLNALNVFAVVADCGSFTQAAARLGMPKARVSTTVKRLEQMLGLSLFHRTTRQVSLSEAGRELFSGCQPLLRGLQDALSRAGNEQAALSGTLRLSAPVDHAEQLLAPAVAEFAQLHPALQIELRISDSVLNLMAEGIDLALRVGWPRDSTARAVKLGEFAQCVVAAPAYLQRRGLPRQPADLAGHDWLALTLLRTPLTWKFSSARGRTQSVRMNARLRTDSSLALRALILSGAGVSAFIRNSIEPHLRDGRLVQLLPQWSLPSGGFYAVYPPGRHAPAAARAFVAFYRGWLQDAQAPLRQG
ncbi:DNA-binding transcriptional regulator, LysR family [Solimonas aquatica]|uniref:DNA-binding transcriptional regulator, LysR family n=1 Tax=Solimonas aquatica TaxID=489703 RepID=A0A1H9D1T5_9GAMM|nr:LysR family transcriptional regulator [Solimonas aquatica]SEQ06783.1 DNA-binding transcriptional regulator, LysR family [Solimonas aquatica]